LKSAVRYLLEAGQGFTDWIQHRSSPVGFGISDSAHQTGRIEQATSRLYQICIEIKPKNNPQKT
jgi:hypothetical protein